VPGGRTRTRLTPEPRQTLRSETTGQAPACPDRDTGHPRTARAVTGQARRWEPKRLRLRVFAVAGRLASSGRRLRLRLAERWAWAAQIAIAASCLQALPSG
jgi:hypothetical protein